MIIEDIYFGSTKVLAAYLGSTKILGTDMVVPPPAEWGIEPHIILDDATIRSSADLSSLIKFCNARKTEVWDSTCPEFLDNAATGEWFDRKSYVIVPREHRDGTNVNGLYRNCNSLKYVNKPNWTNITEADSTFFGTGALYYLPEFDKSKCKSLIGYAHRAGVVGTLMLDFHNYLNNGYLPAHRCAGRNNRLTKVVIDFAGLTRGDEVARESNTLTHAEFYGTENLERFDSIFTYTYNITSVLGMYLPKITTMNDTFYFCREITHVEMYAPNCTEFRTTFQRCSKLKTIRGLDTRNAKVLTNMIDQSGLESLDIDVRSISNDTNATKMSSNPLPLLVDVTIRSIGFSPATYFDFSYLPNWDYDKMILSLRDLSYDRTAAGLDPVTISLAAEAKARLTQEDIDAITNKGYNIT